MTEPCRHPRFWRTSTIDRWVACGYCFAPLERLPATGADIEPPKRHEPDPR